MEDQRIWELEQSLWTGGADIYHETIDADAIFVVAYPPYIMTGEHAAEAMADTPKWAKATFSHQQVSRPEEGLIVIGYRVRAERDDNSYTAHCTTTLRRLGHDDWHVIQHQQSPVLGPH